MRSWETVRRSARETRARAKTRCKNDRAGDILTVLLATCSLQLVVVPRANPLLNGARAAHRAAFGFIAVDAALNDEERAFAIAHELGHHVCHPGSHSCQGDDIDSAALPVTLPFGEGRVWGYHPRQRGELEANIFAGELLAPSDELRERFLAGATYRELAAAYGLTVTCTLNQLLGAVLTGDGTALLAPPGPGPLAPLDASQQVAAETTARRALVEAGPGTGKTKTLIARAEHLLRSGVSADAILVLTFSNNAAEELQERLHRALPGSTGAMIATFHGFALDTLRRFAPQAGLGDDFRVIDEIDAAILLERALPDLDLQHYTHLARPNLYFPAFLAACSRMRDRVLTPEALLAYGGQGDADEAGRGATPLEETLRLLADYDALLASHNLVDYGGLITRTIQVLRDIPGVLAALRHQYRHVLVDEYQDVNRASALLLQQLVAPATNLWVVGDVRQSIFRFRGAEPSNFLDFARDFPGTVMFTLDTNYRSVPALVGTYAAIAGRITGTDPHWHAARPQCADGGVVLARAHDGPGEHAGIVADIARSIASGREPEDHAVLCYTHAQAAEISASLEAAGYATNHLGQFFLRPEIKDMLSLLALCGGQGAALLRIATWADYAAGNAHAEGLLKVVQERAIQPVAALTDPAVVGTLPAEAREAFQRLAGDLEQVRYYPEPAEILLHYLFGEAGYARTLLRGEMPGCASRAGAVFQLIVLARSFPARPLIEPESDLCRAFLRYVRRLLAGRDKAMFQATAPIPGAVNVLTAHASKGLEYPVVYIPNVSDRRFPTRPPLTVPVVLPDVLDDAGDYRDDEARNLFFVAASRARDRLVISRARLYSGKGSTESSLLKLLAGLPDVRRVDWPAGDPDERVTPALAGGRVTITDHELSGLLRCPRQYYLRQRLDLRGTDDERSYLHFVQLLDEGLQLLRSGREEGTLSSTWAVTAASFRTWWDGRWPTTYPLGAFYGRATLRALEREYAAVPQELPPVRRGERRMIDVAGHVVSISIDAIEERDGELWFIWERASKVEGDRRSLQLALYGAAAKAEGTTPPVIVVIRYLADGITEMIPHASRLLAKHPDVQRIPLVIDQARSGTFVPLPATEAECLRCQFVFACLR